MSSNKNKELLNNNLFQIAVGIIGAIYAASILFEDDTYSTATYLIIFSLGVSLIYLLVNGFSKMDKEKIHLNHKSNILGFYIVLGFIFLIGIGIALFWVESIPNKIGDALTILALILTITTDVSTYFLNKILIKIAQRKKKYKLTQQIRDFFSKKS